MRIVGQLPNTLLDRSNHLSFSPVQHTSWLYLINLTSEESFGLQADFHDIDLWSWMELFFLASQFLNKGYTPLTWTIKYCTSTRQPLIQIIDSKPHDNLLLQTDPSQSSILVLNYFVGVLDYTGQGSLGYRKKVARADKMWRKAIHPTRTVIP